MRRLALAAVCVMPIADLALSDATSLWVLRHVDGLVGTVRGGRVVEDVAVGLFILLESVVLAYPVTRMTRLQGVVDGFDAYQEARHATMAPWRAALSRAIAAPFAVLGAIAARAERAGVAMADGGGAIRGALARLLVDVGQVNAIGTTAVAMQETITRGVPVRQTRILRLSAIIAVSWLTTAEVVRGLYAIAGVLGPAGAVIRWPLAVLGTLFDLLSGIDPGAPQTTPVATVFLGAVAVALAVTGWNVARFHETRTTPEPRSG